jgi:hypothetical protein
MNRIVRIIIVFLGATGFILLSLLGFFNSTIFGLFEVDPLHNIIHLLTGILAIIFAGISDWGAALYARMFGLLYGVIGVIGLVVPGDEFFGFHVNTADDFLHLLVAIVFLYLGFVVYDKALKSE